MPDRERLGHAVQPLELQQVIDHLAADKVLVGEEVLQHRLQIAAGFGRDEAVDVAGVDLLAETRRS